MKQGLKLGLMNEQSLWRLVLKVHVIFDRMVYVYDNLVTFPVFQVHFYIVCCIVISFV